MRFTKHALERMKQRGISVDDVRSAVNAPDRVITNGETKFLKRIGKRALVVIARHINGEVVVITAFKTSKVSKYLR